VEPSTPRTVEILKSDRTEEVFLVIANIPIQTVLPASDIERARSWYSEKLGLEPVSTNPFGDLRYEAGGARFLVYQSDLAGTNQATAAGFDLENGGFRGSAQRTCDHPWSSVFGGCTCEAFSRRSRSGWRSGSGNRV